MMEASECAPIGPKLMKRASWQIGRIWAVLPILFLAGCQSVLRPQGLPKDPLFIRQQPIEGKSTGAVPTRIAAMDPAPPPLPVPMTNRPAYARRPSAALPDHVQLTGRLEIAPSQVAASRPPRQVPGFLMNRPFPRDLTLPESPAP